MNFRYVTVRVCDGALEDAMRGMRAMSFTGIGITMPHKQSVLNYLNEVSPDAAIYGCCKYCVPKKRKAFRRKRETLQNIRRT